MPRRKGSTQFQAAPGGQSQRPFPQRRGGDQTPLPGLEPLRLAGIVADDHRLGEQAVGLDAALPPPPTSFDRRCPRQPGHNGLDAPAIALYAGSPLPG